MCQRKKYFETSKNNGCGNISPHMFKMIVYFDDEHAKYRKNGVFE